MAHGKYTWRLEQVDGGKFPFRIVLLAESKVIVQLRTQSDWPGQKGNIFCIREDELLAAPGEVVEELAISQFQRYGKRLSLVLDRPRKKRCDFLFLEKGYKNKPGSYEQIFWRTQTGLTQNRPRTKLTQRATGRQLQVIIDSHEKYAWKFPSAEVQRDALPCGDYALHQEGEILAVAERKTLANMLTELGRLSRFHQALQELEAQPNVVLVVEANYADFFKPAQLKYWKAEFARKALAEVQTFHPNLPVIYAGSRKLAEAWCLAWFESVQKRADEEKDHLLW